MEDRRINIILHCRAGLNIHSLKLTKDVAISILETKAISNVTGETEVDNDGILDRILGLVNAPDRVKTHAIVELLLDLLKALLQSGEGEVVSGDVAAVESVG